jgi:hypothetical protein
MVRHLVEWNVGGVPFCYAKSQYAFLLVTFFFLRELQCESEACFLICLRYTARQRSGAGGSRSSAVLRRKQFNAVAPRRGSTSTA